MAKKKTQAKKTGPKRSPADPLAGRDELTPRAVQIVVRSAQPGLDGQPRGSKLRGGGEDKAAALARRHNFIEYNERTRKIRATPKGVALARELEAQ